MLVKTTFSALAFTALLIPATAWFAPEAQAQLICHNGQCWEMGDNGDECCPFLFDSEFVSPFAAVTLPTEKTSTPQAQH
mgnify:FL=1